MDILDSQVKRGLDLFFNCSVPFTVSNTGRSLTFKIGKFLAFSGPHNKTRMLNGMKDVYCVDF